MPNNADRANVDTSSVLPFYVTVRCGMVRYGHGTVLYGTATEWGVPDNAYRANADTSFVLPCYVTVSCVMVRYGHGTVRCGMVRHRHGTVRMRT